MSTSATTATVWVFNGAGAAFASAVFHTQAQAEQWIRQNQLCGTLTEYPVGLSVYDWALQNGFFHPKKPEHTGPRFIERFSSASQRHMHYENGQ